MSPQARPPLGPESGWPGGAGWPPPAPAGAPPPSPNRGRPQRHLRWFAGAAGAVLVVGIVAVLLATVINPRPEASAPPDLRPPLARLCPPDQAGTAEEPAPGPEPPPATGARTVDQEAGISYRAYGPPWQPWDRVWKAGTLRVPYRVGQHFVTEPKYNGYTDYHASILSAAVPAADNDAVTVNLECVGRQVAADVRAEYYPQPNRMELLRDERTALGGRPAWVTVFRLHFNEPELKATDELVAVACIDVGRPTAAVLYVSIPGTHREFDWVVEDVLASVRPF